jgi:aspartate/methionine/tyrosine aminotransferase
MADIAPFHVMELLTRARQLEAAGRDIVHMEVGEPDFPTPQPVIEAASAFIREGRVFYTPALGIPELREAIARFYLDRYGLDIAPERIAVTAGSSGALLLALGVLLDPGDELLLADPGYPCNRHFVRTLEGVPRALPVGPETDYQPTAEQLARHWTNRTKGLLVASPANPTGTMIPPAEMAALTAVVGERGGALLVDEIYHGLTYGCDAQTALDLSDEVFVINSFSKYFGMTGWRLGWLVARPDVAERAAQLNEFVVSHATSFIQRAAQTALRDGEEELLSMLHRLKANRDFCLDALRQMPGVTVPAPEGAFYLFPRIEGLTDSFAFCWTLLHETKVGIAPGVAFGAGGEGSVRICYAAERSILEPAMDRLARFLRERAET